MIIWEEEQKQIVAIDKTTDFYGAATTTSDNHTRAFLKIQDGCNYVCSFCIIPQARGRSRAITVDQAVAQARQLVADGFKEIVLTGVNIGEYEQMSGERLPHMVEQILDMDGLERLRLSSVEPNTITDELLSVFKSSPKFMHHFHIPLQSGSDEILSHMKRRYTVDQYREIIAKIQDHFPNAGIGADIIAGFPGETEAHFNETYQLAKELPITHFHVFPYSKRQGTLASKMENHIHHQVKKERVQSLLHLGEAKLQLFLEDQLQTGQSVLFERRNKQGLFTGYTPNYVRVAVKTDADLSNQIHSIYLDKMEGNLLMGEIIH